MKDNNFLLVVGNVYFDLRDAHQNIRSVRQTCTLPSQKIKGTACSINHRLPTVYTVVVLHGSYTLEYNWHIPRARLFPWIQV